MRGAPAVTVRCTGGRLWRCLHGLLPAVAASACTGWLALHVSVAQAWATGWALVPAVTAFVAFAIFGLRHGPPPAQLTWDGTQWSCEGRPVRLQVMMDNGASWLLLRLWPTPSGNSLLPSTTVTQAKVRPIWLAVHEHDAARAWHAFRAAVYCAAPHPAARGSTHPPP